MPGMGLVTALVLSLLGADPLWPDLSKLPEATGGGERDAAVVVAVEDYVFLPDVAGASDVGIAWYMYLSKVRRVPVVMLLRDGEATVNKMRDALEKAVKRVQPGGRVWFVFIGHGAPSKDGKDGQLVGVTAQADEMDFYPHTLGRSEVLAILGKASSGAQPPVLVLDACFSGTDMAGATLIKGAQFVVSEELADSKSDQATLLTAGRAKDIAGPLPGAARPAFSYLVLGALRGWGDADGDGVVTAQEAVRYAQDALISLEPGRMQEPQRSGLDQPLTVKLTGSTVERGPDLADIRLALSKGVSNASWSGNVQHDVSKKLAELEKARKEREIWETKAREAERAARAAHEAEVGKVWAEVQRVAKGGGPEAKEALEFFLAQYKDHPLGNPKEAEAKEMLRQVAEAIGAAVNGYVLVKPGCFQMGSPVSEAGRGDDELLHKVCISGAFYVKETEVTQREWREVMGNSPSYFAACGDTCPVENISWWDAIAYANALSAKEGLEQCYDLSWCTGTVGVDYKCSGVLFRGVGCKGYRLPTEAEWEFAARAGTQTATYAGELDLRSEHNAPVLDDIAWYSGNSGVRYSGGSSCSNQQDMQHPAEECGTHPVRQKRPNAWGLYDMIGNVWEWCWDGYEPTYYDHSPGTDPVGPSVLSERVNRGGGYSGGGQYGRAADRSRDNPSGIRYSSQGLRTVRSK